MEENLLPHTYLITFSNEQDAIRYLVDHDWRYIPPTGWKKGMASAKIIKTNDTIQLVFVR